MTEVTRNWCYGAKAPTLNADMVDHQLWLAHNYKNRHIELERNRRITADAFARSLHPQFELDAAEYEVADAAVDAAFDLLKDERIAARSRVDATPAVAAAIREAKRIRCDVGARKKISSKAAYKLVNEAQEPYKARAAAETVIPEGTTPAARDQLIYRNRLAMMEAAGVDAGAKVMYDARLAAREEFRDLGLNWGTYLTVEAATKDYHKGAPPEFRRFDGRGSIGVQIQVGGGLTYAAAVACTNTFLRIQLPPLSERLATTGSDSGVQAHGVAWLRIGSVGHQPIWATVPFVYSREIPHDAVIKWAYLDRVRVGQKYHWKLRLNLKTSQVRRPAENRDMVAAHLGYRLVGEEIRVLTTLDTSGEVSTLSISREEVAAFGYMRKLESIRENASNLVTAALGRWSRVANISEWFQEHSDNISRWRGPERMSRLARSWRDNRFDADQSSSAEIPEFLEWAQLKLEEYRRQPHYRPTNPDDLTTVFGVVEFWRKYDKHLCEWSANQSRKCIARREQLYRTYAANLSKRYNALAIPDVDWAELREKPAVDETDAQSKELRRLASIVSPGRLSAILVEVFSDRAHKTAAQGMTIICNACGEVHEFDKKQRVTTCVHCGATWDQDENAVRNTLANGLVKRARVESRNGAPDPDAPVKVRAVRRDRRRPATT